MIVSNSVMVTKHVIPRGLIKEYNDRGCAGVVGEALGGSGRMLKSQPMRSEDFDVNIRPEPEGTSQIEPKQPGHYSHYTRNSRIPDIFTKMRAEELSLNRRRSHLIHGNPFSNVTTSLLK